jgi:Uma2 family endonuclease
MSTARVSQFTSVEDYLDGELDSDIRHEYLGGSVHAMVGGKVAHNTISTNVVISLGGQLKGQTCQAFGSDMKLRIRDQGPTRFYYPDAMVVCEANPLDDLYQDQPVVIVEVLSDSTRRIDMGEKQDAYLKIGSLTHYILIEQDSATAVVFERGSDGFSRHSFTSLDDTIRIESLNLTLPLRDVYERVLK